MKSVIHFILIVWVFFWNSDACSRLKIKTRLYTKEELQKIMLTAAQEMERTLKIAQKAHLEKIGEIDSDIDPNRTGLIGPDESPIVSTLGQLSSKRTSLTPDFAALVTRWLYESGVQAGDKVAIIATGSFPGFYLAGMCGIRALGAKPIVQLSLASSEWGMTNPQFTILDLEDAICQEIPDWERAKLVTFGGSSDRGRNLSKEGITILTETMDKYGLTPLVEKTFRKQIQQRIKAIQKEGPIKAVILVGGNIAALGNTRNKEIGAGLLTKKVELPENEPSMLKEFLQQNVPVIYLHYAEYLAKKWGIPFDTTPLPPAGSCKKIYHWNTSTN
ncbi:MAG: poly-gamma-glutamate system protein [bacterium]|nr:poly-gamma-glutamate system protein [bacterium]